MLTTTELVERTVPLSKRRQRVEYFSKEYPESVPIFLQYTENQELHRYVVPKDNHFGHLLVAFRRKFQLKSTYGLMCLIENDEGKTYQISTSSSIRSLADKYLHNDGFLYITVTKENVFG